MIVGLGNPGRRYQRTRHNMGFVVVDRLLERLPKAEDSKFFQSEVALTRHGDREVVCLKPGMYMNRSGEPVGQTRARFRVENDAMLVVCDDLDLEPGRLRVRARGSSGGHRGIADVIRAVGDDFARLRIGVGRPPAGVETEDHVLSVFTEQELEIIGSTLDRAVEACLCWLESDVVTTMNDFNPDPGPSGEVAQEEER